MKPRVELDPQVVNFARPLWDTETVKADKPIVAETKTRGTLAVERHRPRMNKLTPAERQQLRDRARQLAFSPPVHGTLGDPTTRIASTGAPC